MVGSTRGRSYVSQEHEQGKVRGRGRGNPLLIQSTLPPSHTIKPYPQSKFKNDQSASLRPRCPTRLSSQHTSSQPLSPLHSQLSTPQSPQPIPLHGAPPQTDRQSTSPNPSPQPSPQPNPLHGASPQLNMQSTTPQSSSQPSSQHDPLHGASQLNRQSTTLQSSSQHSPQLNRRSTSSQPSLQLNRQSTSSQPSPQLNRQSTSSQPSPQHGASPQPSPLPITQNGASPQHANFDAQHNSQPSPQNITNEHSRACSPATHDGATIPTAKSINTVGRIELRLIEAKDNTLSMHPSSELSRRMTASFHQRLADFWPTFGKIPSNYKDLLFDDFLGQVYGYEAYPIETIRKLWKTKASKRYSDMVSDMKEKNAKPIFMSQAIWDQWLQYWNRPEVKDRSKKASTNRNSNPTLHSCGSISIQEHAVKLTKDYGRPPRMLEVFERTHVKAAARNSTDSSSHSWIDPKAANFYDNLMKACTEHLNELRQTAGEDVGELPPETVDSLFESLVVPNAKKRTYPIGNLELPSSSQQSKRQLVSNEDGVHELQKTVEEMRIELDSERAERARLSEQQKADKEAFEAQLAKMMAILKGQERVSRSPSRSVSRSLAPSPSSSA